MVQIKLYKPIDNQKVFVGELLSYADTAELMCGEKKLSIPVTEIAKANIYFDFTTI